MVAVSLEDEFCWLVSRYFTVVFTEGEQTEHCARAQATFLCLGCKVGILILFSCKVLGDMEMKLSKYSLADGVAVIQ